MAKKQNAYFGIDSWIINLILAIIPITNLLFGVVTRFLRGNLLWGVIQLICMILVFGLIVFWIIDLVSMILHKDLKYLA